MSDSFDRNHLGSPDAVLGAALGAAIEARVDAAPAPAPLEAVRARARVITRRRWAGRGLGATAVVAIAVLVGWLASDRQSSAPDVITEPEVSTTTLPAGSTSSLPAGSTSVPNTSVEVTSTKWERVDSQPIQGFADLGTSGGVFFEHGWTAEGTAALLTSVDGVDWTVHVLPDGFSPKAFAASSQRWAVIASGRTGGYPVVAESEASIYPTVPTDQGPAIGPASTVLVSDDRGVTWTELVIDFSVGAGGSRYVAYGADIADVAVLDTTVVVVVVANVVVPDVDALLVDFGPLDPGQQVCSYGASPLGQGMTFTPCEGATVAVEDPAAVFGAESDLIISALGAEVVTAAVLTSIGDGPLQATTTVEFGESASVTVSVVDGGFVVLDENSAHQSSDGITWTRAALTGRVPREPVEGPGGLWGAAGGEIGDTSVLHSSDGAVWEAISTTTGFEIFDLAVGPAGFAAVAASTDPDQSTTGTQLWIGISPDGAGWDWQPIGEALGIEGGEFTYAQIAVGDEVVIVLASNSGDAEPGLFRRPLQ